MLLTTTSKSKTNHHPIVYHTVQKNRPALTLISLTQFWSAKPAIIVPIYGLLYRSIRIEIGASYSNPTTRTIRVEAASHSFQMQFATTNTTTHRIHYKRRTLVRIVLRGSSSKSVSTTPHSCKTHSMMSTFTFLPPNSRRVVICFTIDPLLYTNSAGRFLRHHAEGHAALVRIVLDAVGADHLNELHHGLTRAHLIQDLLQNLAILNRVG